MGIREDALEEISPHIMEMRKELDNKPKNNKVVSRRIGNRKYTLLETKTERNLYVLIGDYYSKQLYSFKIKKSSKPVSVKKSRTGSKAHRRKRPRKSVK